MLIGIDPGHGAKDTGACVAGIAERDLVEEAAQFLHAYLSASSIKCLHTRTVGEDPPFVVRGWKTRQCDAVVSLHVNANVREQVDGMELYHWPNSKAGKALAGHIAVACPQRLKPTNRTGTRTPRIWSAADGPGAQDNWLQRPRAVMRWHRPPIVLVELGFLTNDDDREFLTRSGGLESAVICVADGLETWLKYARNRRENSL